MRAIKISDGVWHEIAKRGAFGETEDDVLRRVFSLPPQREDLKMKGTQMSPGSPVNRKQYATTRNSCYISQGRLYVKVDGGPQKSWELPSKSDKEQLRCVRDEAVELVERHGATIGQINAVKKVLTDHGYHLTK